MQSLTLNCQYFSNANRLPAKKIAGFAKNELQNKARKYVCHKDAKQLQLFFNARLECQNVPCTICPLLYVLVSNFYKAALLCKSKQWQIPSSIKTFIGILTLDPLKVDIL